MIGSDQTRRHGPERSCERGVALITAMLIMVIMTLLGIPFLLMGETENRIAENEKLSLQALYVAEAGALIAQRWFEQLLGPGVWQLQFHRRGYRHDLREHAPGVQRPVLPKRLHWALQ